MASAIYNSFKKSVNNGADWTDNATTVIKAMLVTSSYAINIDTHEFKSSVTNEVVGTNYVAGGAAITNRAITIDTANDWARYGGDDVVWANSTITAYAAVVYEDTGNPATSALIAYIDFGANKSSAAGPFTIQWHADGVFRLA